MTDRAEQRPCLHCGTAFTWTPADPEDSLTETDLMTTYPEMRSL